VSADGLFLGGYEHLIPDLQYSEIERPIVAQFFTSKPEMMYKAAKLAVELGFDGVDINMGCPDKSVEKQGAGAALIKNPELAKEIIKAANHKYAVSRPILACSSLEIILYIVYRFGPYYSMHPFYALKNKNFVHFNRHHPQPFLFQFFLFPCHFHPARITLHSKNRYQIRWYS
jgi:hypothetical protein